MRSHAERRGQGVQGSRGPWGWHRPTKGPKAQGITRSPCHGSRSLAATAQGHSHLHHPLPWLNAPARIVLPVWPKESTENKEREHKEGVPGAAAGASFPSSPRPERWQRKSALLQAAALSSQKHLPARRGAAIFHICILYCDSSIQQARSALSRDTKGLFPH